ncbi:odorant receptor 130 [Tribolium castaneum]|uniref:Odorant receptor n=1 Tax=Tribolium castaneum TaxID=7070 RepID=D1ZZK8_TRICA|nr:odorant receptor 130 [Tribolium castaneum]
MSSKNYLSFPTGFLLGTGLLPESKFSRKIVSIGVFTPMTLFLVYLIVKKARNGENKDVLLWAELFESLTTCAHILSRKYVMYVHGGLISQIIKERGCYFWNYDIFGPKFGQTLERKMNICTKIVKIVVSGGVVTIVLFCLTTVFDKSKVVPLVCWTPEDSLQTGIIYAMEVLIMFEIMWALLSIDCFYLLICTDLRIQFILLQRMIKSIKFGSNHDEKSFAKMVHCTQHHKFLLHFHAKLNTIFSSYFIVLYLVTVACASMHTYIILFKQVANLDISDWLKVRFRSPGFGDSIKSACYLSGMLFQVGLYFVITSNVEIEVVEIYNLNWENTGSVKIRKHVLFMLMKSQEELSVTGGGMLHVKRNEYVGLVRLAYTIATILGGMT